MEIGSAFLDLMNRGGPVMWVIFVVAWLAFIMLVERGLRVSTWRRHAKYDQDQFDRNKQYVPNVTGSPISLLINQINWNDVKDKEEVAEQLNIRLAELMPRMEGSLPTIAVVGSILPMLGLLGTVTGMIEVFEVIALQGSGGTSNNSQWFNYCHTSYIFSPSSFT